jgi:transposase
MKANKRYSPIERERAVRLVFDQQHQHSSQWSAIESITGTIGCTAETLRRWVRQSETDLGKRSGISSTDRDRLKELERENRELKQANGILHKASVFFAQAEFDRRPK